MPGYTKEAIARCFFRLLDELPLGQIRVRQIIDACGISRSTFYYHYKDIRDLFESTLCDSVQYFERECRTPDRVEHALVRVSRLFREYPHAVEHVEETADRALCRRQLLRACEHIARVCLGEGDGGGAGEEPDQPMLRALLRCQCYGLFIEWIEGGAKGDVMAAYRSALSLFGRAMSRQGVI